jgi:large conductance mechanosensitive channel
MWQEFRDFIMRGNVMDLAIGVIIGGAFSGIVSSLVSDVLMPPLGLLMGGLDFSDFFITLKGDGSYQSLAAAKAAGAVTLNFGLFANAVIRFLIVAAAIFVLIKQLNRFVKINTPAGPSKTESLLGEIRDLLAKPRA